MPIEVYEVPKIIDLQARDGDVTKAEGALWADLQDAGVLKWGTEVLKTAFNEVRDLDLPDEKKLPGLEAIGGSLKSNARSIHRHFWDVPYKLLDNIGRRTQIRDDKTLLEMGRTKEQRHEIADAAFGDVAGVLRLVQMADLQRVNGIGPMLSSVIHQSGIESIPALANADARDVETGLNAYAASLTGRAVKFRVPPRYRIQDYIDSAKTMEPAVEYGSIIGSKPIEDRARLLLDGHEGFQSSYVEGGIDAWAVGDRGGYRGLLLENQAGFVAETVDLMNAYADSIPEWHDKDGNVVHPDPLTAHHLMSGYYVPYMDNQGYDFNVKPHISDYSEDGEYRGTVIQWEAHAYCEDAYSERIVVSFVFDAAENRIVARDYQVWDEYENYEEPVTRQFELLD